MIVALLIVAVILAGIEAARDKSLGWAAVAFLAFALLWPHLGTLS